MDEEAPISRSPLNGFMTFGGTSIALTEQPTVRITFGPPHENEWTRIDWSRPSA